MSFILDALRKSDQQRKRGAAPRLQTVQATAAARKQPPVLLYGLFAAILLGAGIAIGWWRPWQPERPASTGATLAAKPVESNPPQIAAPALPPLLPQTVGKPTREMPVQKPKSASQPQAPRAAAATKRPASAKVETQNRPREAVTAAPKEETTPVSEKPVGAGLAPSAQEQKLMALSELPPSIQQEIPAMTIAAHAYSSNPRDRLVNINNRTLREGDYLQPGLGLEQIRPDGMIFSYKGYRFIRGVR